MLLAFSDPKTSRAQTSFRVGVSSSFPRRGSQYRPQNSIVHIIGTPKRVSLILGDSHL